MKKLKLIDVTLRDGGYRNNFNFTHQQIKTILTYLDTSGVEYIEIGYKNGLSTNAKNIGVTGICDTKYLNLCNSQLKHAKIAVMVHPENIQTKDIKELKYNGVSLIRVCVSHGNFKLACRTINLIKEYKMSVSANIIRASKYQIKDLDVIVSHIADCNPSVIFFADSNGALHPENVTGIYNYFIGKYQIQFGYHAHDNIGLALTNTLAAYKAGSQWIDASLSGLGKGAGNLKLEFLVACLQSMKINKYNLNQIILASNFIRKEFNTDNIDLIIDDFNRGIYNLNLNQCTNAS